MTPIKTETQCLPAGYNSDPNTLACPVLIYRATSYVFDSIEHVDDILADLDHALTSATAH